MVHWSREPHLPIPSILYMLAIIAYTDSLALFKIYFINAVGIA